MLCANIVWVTIVWTQPGTEICATKYTQECSEITKITDNNEKNWNEIDD